jgi:CcmD family protein
MTTPDTVNYMILGYVVFSIVMGAYLFSLVLRRRNMDQEIEILDEIQRKEAKKQK